MSVKPEPAFADTLEFVAVEIPRVVCKGSDLFVITLYFFQNFLFSLF